MRFDNNFILKNYFHILKIKKSVAIGSDKGMVKIYDFNGNLLKSFQAHGAMFVARIVQLPNGYVATDSGDITAKIWDPSQDWKLVQTYKGHSDWLTGMVYIDSDRIATGSYDSSVHIWSISTGALIRKIPTGSAVSTLGLLKDGTSLLAGCKSGDTEIYNVNTGSRVNTLKGHTKWVEDFVELNNNQLASSSWDFDIRIWDLATGQTKFTLKGHSGFAVGLKLAAPNILVSVSNDKTVRTWDVTTGRAMNTFTGHSGEINWGLDILRDKRQIVSGSMDKSIKIWDVATSKLLNTINTDVSIFSLTILNQRTSNKKSISK